MSLPRRGEYPIQCAKKQCKWKGYETDLEEQPYTFEGCPGSKHVCPDCGNAGYHFLTARQRQYWDMPIKQGESK